MCKVLSTGWDKRLEKGVRQKERLIHCYDVVGADEVNNGREVVVGGRMDMHWST